MTARSETYAQWLNLWYQAQGSPQGIYVRAINTEDLASIRNYLYVARRNSDDPSLNSLQIRTSITRPMDELWIVKP